MQSSKGEGDERVARLNRARDLQEKIGKLMGK